MPTLARCTTKLASYVTFVRTPPTTRARCNDLRKTNILDQPPQSPLAQPNEDTQSSQPPRTMGHSDPAHWINQPILTVMSLRPNTNQASSPQPPPAALVVDQTLESTLDMN